ncbi:hypothetical protein GALMADRAFT_797566 [Galerina marginata CBS 339.88]|uniref:Uncharacterized protein n=1 Tax=Galerina marginata (strain CBS 339.88) TaxID=685588 RepID=A0A067SU83_GALM3|nr:hypothetical protein GALMADRAFT_797566 [Galerina marginata CBS 339.88]
MLIAKRGQFGAIASCTIRSWITSNPTTGEGEGKFLSESWLVLEFRPSNNRSFGPQTSGLNFNPISSQALRVGHTSLPGLNLEVSIWLQPERETAALGLIAAFSFFSSFIFQRSQNTIIIYLLPYCIRLLATSSLPPILPYFHFPFTSTLSHHLFSILRSLAVVYCKWFRCPIFVISVYSVRRSIILQLLVGSLLSDIWFHSSQKRPNPA